MRIAFLTSEFVSEPSFAGGLAQYLGRVTKGLVKRGHHVEVFVSSSADEQLQYDGLIVHRVRPQKWGPLRVVNGSLRLLRQRSLIETQNACSIANGLYKAFSRRALEMSFDIVQASSWLGTGLFLSRQKSVPLVVRVSSYGPLLDGQCDGHISIDRKLCSYIERMTLGRAGKVYAPSIFLANEIRRESGLIAEVVRPPFYKSNGALKHMVQIDDLADWPKYLLFFGRLCRYKGVGLLAQAIEPLFKEIPDLKLALAGPVEKQDAATKQLIALMNAYPDRIRYIGKLTPHELSSIIKASHAVVLPSLMENLSNACIEAMSYGKVVIGPDGVSFDELIEDGRSGILFNLGDANSLRQAILRTWNMPRSQRTEISKAAEARILSMTPEITLNDLENLYETLIKDAEKGLKG